MMKNLVLLVMFISSHAWSPSISRRETLFTATLGLAVAVNGPAAPADAAGRVSPTIDVNNAMAREFTVFPGLYPTIATKLVNAAKEAPFQSKTEMYDALDSDIERARLKVYDAALIVSKKPDSNLKQYKASQICKYECKSRVSSAFQDDQIKDVQAGRWGWTID